MAKGFAITGHWDETGVFPKKLVEATRKVEDLYLTAPVAQQACENMRPSKIAGHDAAVWKETMEELEKGWLRGPYSLE